MAARTNAREWTAREWTARAMTEKQWQSLVLDLARVHGWWAYHTHDSRRSEAGFPDLVLIRAGELMFVELKREGGSITVEQACVLGMLRCTGAEVHIWLPRDEAEVLARLSAPRVAAVEA